MKTTIKNILLTTSIISSLVATNAVAAPTLDPSAVSNVNVTLTTNTIQTVGKAGLKLDDFKAVVSNGGATIFSNANILNNPGQTAPNLQDNTNTLINQTAGTTHILFNDFSTNAGDKVYIAQPSTASNTFLEVKSGKVSTLKGLLDNSLGADGHVIIQNDAGVLFFNGGQTNINNLTATTAKTATLNANGTYTFSNFGDGKVDVEGTINSKDGYVLALAKKIDVGSTGQINGMNSTVALDSGATAYAVDLTGNGKVLYTASAAADTTSGHQINVLGTIKDSGNVMIKARSSMIGDGSMNISGIVDVSPQQATPTSGGGVIGTPPTIPGQVLHSGMVTLSSTGDANLTGAKILAPNADVDISANGSFSSVKLAGTTINAYSLDANSNGFVGGLTSTGTTINTTGAANLGANGQYGNLNTTDTTINSGGTSLASGNLNGSIIAKNTNINSSGAVVLDSAKVNGSITYQGNITGSKISSSTGNTALTGNFKATAGDLTVASNYNTTTAGSFSASNNLGFTTARQQNSSGDYSAGGAVAMTSTSDAIMLSDGTVSGKTVAINSKGSDVTLSNTSLLARDALAVNAGGSLTVANDSSHYLALKSNGTSSGTTVARSVKLTSGDDMTVNSDIETVRGDTAGSVIASSGGNTTFGGTINTSSATMGGGAVTIASAGTTDVNKIYTGGVDKNGGDVTITSKGKATLNGGIVTASSSSNPAANVISGDVVVTSSTAGIEVKDVINTSGQIGGKIALGSSKGAFIDGANARYISTGTKTGGAVTIAYGAGSDLGGFNSANGASNIFSKIDASGKKAGVVKVSGPKGVLDPNGQL